MDVVVKRDICETMQRREVTAGTWETTISMEQVMFRVPAVRRDPRALSTGRLSPVRADSST